jgi:hypothetical protein
MELDSRKNEAKADLKQQDITIEVSRCHSVEIVEYVADISALQELLNKAIVNISDLRTVVEENKWENMRRAVRELMSLVLQRPRC